MVMRQELQLIEGISGFSELFCGDFWLVKIGEEVTESKESAWSTSVIVISSEGSSLISLFVKLFLAQN